MTVPTSEMVEALRRLVEVESGSRDPAGVARCADLIQDLCEELLGSRPDRAEPNLVWRRQGERPVLLLCHFDTVWPAGTLEQFPYTVEDGVARGPGAFDMKAGIVQTLYAVRETTGPVVILFTADEEIGSATSRALIEEEAARARAVLVTEPAEGTAVKVARKGVAVWRLEVHGRAAHAGLEPEKGVNAIAELARLILDIERLARPEEGTTLTVTMITGGSADNVVPESAQCAIDGRMWTLEEAERIQRELASLPAKTPEARLELSGGLNRGPLERVASEALYQRLVALGYDVGAAEVGGASDGNFTAALGVPTLDGLGAVGGGAHSRDEHVLVEEMPRRAEMLARLIEDVLADT
ncbi:MAG: M20 family metallopeptidase [Actinomycetota bacterium]